MVFPHFARENIITFLKVLRDEIIQTFESLETTAVFNHQSWPYIGDGGGVIGLLRGHIFEKAAVNWSGVGGKSLPSLEEQQPFFATGVSLITHMSNPHAPTAHFNIRFIETPTQWWFGGGYDLSPMGFSYQEDTEHFHATARQAVEPFGADLYSNFSKQARDYFYIPHRQKERGVGGIFFDHYNTGDFSKDYTLWQAIGHSFLPAIMPIYQRRIQQSFTPQEKDIQLQMRAHYVEFNLMYDRGTKFGFQSGGNPEAILCSMPPLVKW